MEIETKPDMLAFQWSKGAWDLELMLSLEPHRWGLPLSAEWHHYRNVFHGIDCVSLVWTIRILCGAIHLKAESSLPVEPETITPRELARRIESGQEYTPRPSPAPTGLTP